MFDTSAWIEFLRDTGSPICKKHVRSLGNKLTVSDLIRMEVLAGARSDAHLEQLRGLLESYTPVQATPSDYELAGVLCRRCRANGETVRKLIDCLIAAIAIRNNFPLLHMDADFDFLEQHTEHKVMS